MINKNKPTLILGAYGRTGQQLVQLMDEAGYNILYPTHSACDLLNNYSYEQYFHANKPSYVINLSGRTTNINLCNQYPASICRDTLAMNISVLEMCKKHSVEKLINIISSCAYNGDSAVLREEDFFKGSPHASIMPHGLAKRTVAFLGQSYARQFHMNVVNIVLNNLFGCCSWDKPNSLKFLDSLIVKIVDAKLLKYKTVDLWGSGKPRREVLFTRDAATGILEAFAKYDSPELINLGTGEDKTIAEWAELVCQIVKWKGELVYNKEKPDGQMVKRFDCEKMRNVLQWTPPTNVEDAIRETVDTYKEFCKNRERKSYRLV